MKIDMTPKAVKNRLKMVSQLWRLSISLGKAKRETAARRKSISKNTDKDFIIVK